MLKNGWINEIRLILKFMTSQPGQQTNAIHILSNISRSKGNQTMKFGQLLEYNMRNIFVEKSYTKFSGETIPRPFFKKLKLSRSLPKVLYSLFLSYAKLRTIEIYWNKAPDHLLLPQIKLFQKTKRGLELISLPHLHDFWRKIFPFLDSISWPNFVV